MPVCYEDRQYEAHGKHKVQDKEWDPNLKFFFAKIPVVP